MSNRFISVTSGVIADFSLLIFNWSVSISQPEKLRSTDYTEKNLELCALFFAFVLSSGEAAVCRPMAKAQRTKDKEQTTKNKALSS
jgi:hypothetical protein